MMNRAQAASAVEYSMPDRDTVTFAAATYWAARMAVHAGMMIRAMVLRAAGEMNFSAMSGRVKTLLRRTLRARTVLRTSSPTAPEPSHQKAGVPDVKASPVMPMVADAPTHDATMEIPTTPAP